VLIYLLGILALGLAVALLKRGNLGVPPWDTSTLNLQSYLASLSIPITVGQSSLLHTTFLLLLTLIITRSWKAFYAILPMLLVSQSIDLFDLLILKELPSFQNDVVIQLMLFIIGTLVMTFGLAAIIVSGYPPNIYDAFQLGIMKVFHIRSFTLARWILEFSGIGLGILYALLEPGEGFGTVTWLSIGLAAVFGTIIKQYIKLFKKFKLMNREGL
jgi:uncharacterized membrane protein YczE